MSRVLRLVCLPVVALGLQGIAKVSPVIEGGANESIPSKAEGSVGFLTRLRLTLQESQRSLQRRTRNGGGLQPLQDGLANASGIQGHQVQVKAGHALSVAGGIFGWLAAALGGSHMTPMMSALGTKGLSLTSQEILWSVVLAVSLGVALAAFAMVYVAWPLYRTEKVEETLSVFSEAVARGRIVPKDHSSLALVAVFMVLAVIFNCFVFATEGGLAAEEWLTCYCLEYSLSVDNLFMFIVIFDYFKLPMEVQATCLSYGIWGAILFRFVFVCLGAEMLQKASFLILPFAAILIYTSYRGFATSDGDEEDEDEDMDNNCIVQGVRVILEVSPSLDGGKFFTEVDGRRMVTPLFVCLLVIEFSDVVFATDSVPAVLATTRDPFIAYSSNVFAIFGLRALFFVLKDAMVEFTHLGSVVNLVLGFLGVKILLEYFAVVELPMGASLLLILGTLAAGIVLSLLFPKKPSPPQAAG